MVQVVATWVLGSLAILPVGGLVMGGLRVMNGGRASARRVPERLPLGVDSRVA